MASRMVKSGSEDINFYQVVTIPHFPAQDSGSSATSAQPATDTSPPDTVNSPAPQGRPPVPQPGGWRTLGTRPEGQQDGGASVAQCFVWIR